MKVLLCSLFTTPVSPHIHPACSETRQTNGSVHIGSLICIRILWKFRKPLVLATLAKVLLGQERRQDYRFRETTVPVLNFLSPSKRSRPTLRILEVEKSPQGTLSASGMSITNDHALRARFINQSSSRPTMIAIHRHACELVISFVCTLTSSLSLSLFPTFHNISLRPSSSCSVCLLSIQL